MRFPLIPSIYCCHLKKINIDIFLLKTIIFTNDMECLSEYFMKRIFCEEFLKINHNNYKKKSKYKSQRLVDF
jgi:hypothetical protein